VTSPTKEAALSTYETPNSAPERPGTSATEQARGKVQQATGAAQDKAQQATGEIRSRMRDQVDQRSTQAGERMAGVAQDARSVGEHLRGQGKERPAMMADRAAERVERVGDYLKRVDGDAILRDVERIGRERPWAVMAGGLMLGFAASRFLKASSSRRYREIESAGNRSARTTPTPAVAEPIPAAPDRELSLSGGVLPDRPHSGPDDR
jgi:hypothetical protein